MSASNDELIAAMTALKFRISTQGAGVPYLIPIPGRGGNHGILKYIGLPSDHHHESIPNGLSNKGIARDITAGLVAGFELNEAEQVAPLDKSSSHVQSLRQGCATYDGKNMLWKVSPKHYPEFVDKTSNLAALIDTVRRMDVASTGGDDTDNAAQQLAFLEETLQKVRQQLADDDREVAKRKLELRTLKLAERHTALLHKQVRADEQAKRSAGRQHRIDQGRNIATTIVMDPVTHVAAIHVLTKILSSQSFDNRTGNNNNNNNNNNSRGAFSLSSTPSHRPTHGKFENVLDVLKGQPAFVEIQTRLSSLESSDIETKTSHHSAAAATFAASTGVTESDFNGIEMLAAHNMDQLFTHYVVTVVSEGGRRMEINLPHQNAKSLYVETKSITTDNTLLTFGDLRDECCKVRSCMIVLTTIIYIINLTPHVFHGYSFSFAFSVIFLLFFLLFSVFFFFFFFFKKF